MNQTCYALTSKRNTPLALYCSIGREIAAIVSAAHGSVFDTITTSTFERSMVLQPTPELIEKFEDTIGPLFAQIVKGTERMNTLATLRDTLLPRLISGQLRLPEVEAQL